MGSWFQPRVPPSGRSHPCPEIAPAGMRGLRPTQAIAAQPVSRKDRLFKETLFFFLCTKRTSYFIVGGHSLGLDKSMYDCSGPEISASQMSSHCSLIEGAKQNMFPMRLSCWLVVCTSVYKFLYLSEPHCPHLRNGNSKLTSCGCWKDLTRPCA